jgi:hypothetical protein
MSAPPGVCGRQNKQGQHPLPKFMLPVTLGSFAPHPYLPFQPHKSQFIILPSQAESVQQPPPMSDSPPKNILAAAKSGDLEWVKRYSEAGQTELVDRMGEVF